VDLEVGSEEEEEEGERVIFKSENTKINKIK